MLKVTMLKQNVPLKSAKGFLSLRVEFSMY